MRRLLLFLLSILIPPLEAQVRRSTTSAKSTETIYASPLEGVSNEMFWVIVVCIVVAVLLLIVFCYWFFQKQYVNGSRRENHFRIRYGRGRGTNSLDALRVSKAQQQQSQQTPKSGGGLVKSPSGIPLARKTVPVSTGVSLTMESPVLRQSLPVEALSPDPDPGSGRSGSGRFLNPDVESSRQSASAPSSGNVSPARSKYEPPPLVIPQLDASKTGLASAPPVGIPKLDLPDSLSSKIPSVNSGSGQASTTTAVNTDLPLSIPAYMNMDYNHIRIDGTPIGKGTSAEVFKCSLFETTFNQFPKGMKFVCKIFKDVITDPVFFQEVAIMADLSKHSSISKIYAYCTTPKRLIVMEFFEYGSLGMVIRNHKLFSDSMFPEGVLLSIILDITEGLNFMHSKDIVHNDIKPDNVLVRRNQTKDAFVVAITDFSASCALSSYKAQGVMSFTSVQVNAASIYYLAPEYLQPFLTGSTMTTPYQYYHVRDIYAIGISAFELIERKIAGKLMGPDKPAATKAIMQGLRPPFSDRCVNYPRLRYIAEMCWNHDYTQRPVASQVCAYIKSQLETRQ